MDYQIHDWKAGDLISSTRLNAMETGIATGRIVFFNVGIDGTGYPLLDGITPKIILEILQNNCLPIFKIVTNNGTSIDLGFFKNIICDDTYSMEIETSTYGDSDLLYYASSIDNDFLYSPVA